MPTCLPFRYGRMEELVAFAGARGDHEAVLEYLMQVGMTRNAGGAYRGNESRRLLFMGR